jgi:cytidylate kinase
MNTIDSVERFLEIQVQEWGRRGEKRKGNRAGPVITISREPGSNGDFIAQTLAKKFGLDLYDWKIVEEIAKDAHVSEQAVATLDEIVASELDDWLTGIGPGPGFSSSQYMQGLRKVLFTVATHGNAVIMGRGANFLLPPEKITLGLRLVAPLDARVKNIMRGLRLSQKGAIKHITDRERERRLWVKKYCRADINDAANYHAVINTALVATETILQIVKEILKAKS